MVWHSWVRYQPFGGAPVTFRNPLGGVPPLHRVGQPVTVLYDPNNPSTARVETPRLRALLPMLVMLLGGCCWLYALGSALYFLRHPLTAPQ